MKKFGMKRINEKYISSRISPVLKIIKLFEDAPVYDLDEIAERTGFAKSTVRTLASRLALPSLNVRKWKKTYLFLTKNYLETQFVPVMRKIVVQQAWAAVKCGETFPIDVFVEASPSNSPNYLIVHDFTVSQVLLSLNDILFLNKLLDLSYQKGVRFSPVTVHLITTKGHVEPDIISVFEPSENEEDLLPVIFEIVQTLHSTRDYFYYPFLKYNEIADICSRLFANIIINDNIAKDIDKHIENISRGFARSLKDKNPEISKEKVAWILHSGGLTVYIWKLSTVLSDTTFNTKIESQTDLMLQQGLFINPDIINLPGHHIERVNVRI